MKRVASKRKTAGGFRVSLRPRTSTAWNTPFKNAITLSSSRSVGMTTVQAKRSSISTQRLYRPESIFSATDSILFGPPERRVEVRLVLHSGRVDHAAVWVVDDVGEVAGRRPDALFL